MSISYTDISAAITAAGLNPDNCRIVFDPPGPDWENVTAKLNLPKSVLRDLERDELEVYAAPAPVPVAAPPQPRAAQKVRDAIARAVK